MANILIGANVQVGTGQATANMRQFTQTVNREFNSIKTSVNGANNSFNRFERNISQMNHNVTTVFHNMENAVNNWRNSFRTAVANVSTLLGFQLIGSALRNINETLQQTERSIGALQAITDGVDGAKAKFAELNDLSRTVPQSFDEITQAALTLGRNGLDTSAQSIKALAEIARGTGQSFTSVAQALTSASMGQLRGLKQLGITAVQEGDKIKLTYKGVTETIKADTAELQNYMNKLANSQFADTLKPEMEGVTGATKRVSEAWGDMWRQLGDSGLFSHGGAPPPPVGTYDPEKTLTILYDINKNKKYGNKHFNSTQFSDRNGFYLFQKNAPNGPGCYYHDKTVDKKQNSAAFNSTADRFFLGGKNNTRNLHEMPKKMMDISVKKNKEGESSLGLTEKVVKDKNNEYQKSILSNNSTPNIVGPGSYHFLPEVYPWVKQSYNTKFN